MKRIGIKPFWMFVVLLFLLAGCGGTPDAEPTLDPEQNLPFTPIVSATGEVIPVEWATLGAVSGGVVESILVEEGERVQTGQPLLRFKGTERLQAQVTAGELAVLQARQNLKTLNDQWEQDKASAGLRLAQAKKALDQADKRKFNAAYRRGSQNQIDTAAANLVLAQEEVDRLEDIWSNVQDRPEDDTARASVLSQLSAARVQRDLAKASLNYLIALPDEIEVGMTDAQIAAAQAEVDAAQRQMDQLKDGPNPDQLTLAETNIRNAVEQLKAAQSALADLEISAPFNGTISKLYVRARESVQPGAPVLQLANLTEYQVQTTDLSEIDVARISEGNRVTLTFDALPDVTVGGRVHKISPRSSEGSGVNYTVKIVIDQVPDNLRWGMTAFADIEAGE